MESAKDYSPHPLRPDGAALCPDAAGLAEAEAVVYYRKPHASHYERLIQHSLPLALESLQALPLSGGYVVMPFVATEECPILFIEPDDSRSFGLVAPRFGETLQLSDDRQAQRAAYARAFAQAHRHLSGGALQKVVLSRRLNVRLSAPAGQEVSAGGKELLIKRGYSLFLKACHYRPNSFVSFWWTRRTGAWLVATPEPLLEKRNHGFGTVALAGTLPWKNGEKPVWDAKNCEEQALVARFIAGQLSQVATDIRQSATYTLHTGNIQHLCTDFHFGLPAKDSLREVLLHLHPTPAVCGQPRTEALRAILAAEPSPRRYYAGFSGPLLLKGDTSLYVSLRCMELTGTQATLYAGGGLMPESIEADEWEETQRKLQTMLCLL